MAMRLRTIGHVVALALTQTACSIPYYWQAIGGQVGLLADRRPLERAVEDPALDARRRAVLERVPEILEFAETRLGLASDGSYRGYVDLDRPYVVWNVVATREFSVRPEQWCFPFAGCVAYRGYFDRESALEFERGLADSGFDTFSRGATAYSTLGFFNDPVLSTMLRAGPNALAGLLFHELAHQRLYVKGDSDFNEAFATALEEHGMQLWLAEHGEPGAVERYRRQRCRRDEFVALVFRQQQRLAAIYASDADAAAMRRDKREAFDLMRSEYVELRTRWGDDMMGYDAWFEQDLNNASLAAVATYRRWLPVLRARLDAVGLEDFLEDAERAADMDTSTRESLLASWDPADRGS